MTSTSVFVVEPAGYVHGAVFDDVADALVHGLSDLGHDARRVARPDTDADLSIVLGANLLAQRPELAAGLGPDALLWNLEQIDPGSPWCGPELIALLRRHRVLDYSPQNVARLRDLGIDATLLAVGHHPVLERIPELPQDIDVLFYGSLNDRRARILQALVDRGAVVHHAFGVYGAERDALIARSRIVLNIHHFDARVFEIVRVSYLLANGRFVVSERGGDADLEAPFADGVAFADHDEIVDTCEAFLANSPARDAVAERGRELMRARPQAASIASALAQLAVPA